MRPDQRQFDVEAALKLFGCTNLKVGKKAVPDTRHQLGVRKAAHRLFDVRGRNAQRTGNFDDRQRRFVGDDKNVLLIRSPPTSDHGSSCSPGRPRQQTSRRSGR